MFAKGVWTPLCAITALLKYILRNLETSVKLIFIRQYKHSLVKGFNIIEYKYFIKTGESIDNFYPELIKKNMQTFSNMKQKEHLTAKLLNKWYCLLLNNKSASYSLENILNCKQRTDLEKLAVTGYAETKEPSTFAKPASIITATKINLHRTKIIYMFKPMYKIAHH